LFFVLALCERQNEKQKKESTMLPQALAIYTGKCVTPNYLKRAAQE